MRSFLVLLFYNLFIIAPSELVLNLVGLFNKKIGEGIRVRRGWAEKLKQDLALTKQGKRILFHVASAGELQQALPIIKHLKETDPKVVCGIAFFSVSGYRFFKPTPLVDFIAYAPFDTPANATLFMSIVQPQVYVIVSYDAWLNHVTVARNSGAEIVLAGGILTAKSSRLRFPLRLITRETFSLFSKLYVIGEADKEQFQNLLGENSVIEVAGEPRYDHILNNIASASSVLSNTLIPKWENSTIMTLGSIWPAGWDYVGKPLLEAVENGVLKLFIAPHSMSDDFIVRVETECESRRIDVARLSQLSGDFNGEKCSVVIIDSIGLLAALYSKSSIAYVGGAFGKGVHNVAEPAAFGMPLYFGPRFEHSLEARLAVADGAAVVVQSSSSFENDLKQLLGDDSLIETRAGSARNIISRNAGTSKKIADWLVNTVIND